MLNWHRTMWECMQAGRPIRQLVGQAQSILGCVQKKDNSINDDITNLKTGEQSS